VPADTAHEKRIEMLEISSLETWLWDAACQIRDIDLADLHRG
jgi:hypothetical protein